MGCCENARVDGPSEKHLGRRATLKWLASLAGGAAAVRSGLAHGQSRDARRVRLAFCGQLL